MLTRESTITVYHIISLEEVRTLSFWENFPAYCCASLSPAATSCISTMPSSSSRAYVWSPWQCRFRQEGGMPKASAASTVASRSLLSVSRSCPRRGMRYWGGDQAFECVYSMCALPFESFRLVPTSDHPLHLQQSSLPARCVSSLLSRP
jgi:hypothetical protein